jgi:hypothetical protein
MQGKFTFLIAQIRHIGSGQAILWPDWQSNSPKMNWKLGFGRLFRRKQLDQTQLSDTQSNCPGEMELK